MIMAGARKVPQARLTIGRHGCGGWGLRHAIKTLRCFWPSLSLAINLVSPGRLQAKIPSSVLFPPPGSSPPFVHTLCIQYRLVRGKGCSKVDWGQSTMSCRLLVILFHLLYVYVCLCVLVSLYVCANVVGTSIKSVSVRERNNHV